MGLENYDSNELLEALANRGIDARPIGDFSLTEIYDEMGRRLAELDAKKQNLKQKYYAIGNPNAQAEIDAEIAQAESDAMRQAEAEAGIEADRERAEAEAMAEAEAQAAEADAQAQAEAENNQ